MVETFSPWLRLAALPCAGEAYNASKLPIVHTTVSNNAAMERTSFNRHQLSCSSPFFKKCFYWNLETLLGIAPFTRENREECVGIRTRVIQVKKRKINSGQKAVLIHFSLFAFWELVRQPIPSRPVSPSNYFVGYSRLVLRGLDETETNFTLRSALRAVAIALSMRSGNVTRELNVPEPR